MTRTAWLFPGQGFEEPGMGVALLRSYSPTRDALLALSTTLDLDLISLVERGGVAVSRTEVLQPLLVLLSLLSASMQLGVEKTPDVVAGHSLGELTAWAFASACPIETAVQLAYERGTAMREAASRTVGAMAALRCTRAEWEVLPPSDNVVLAAHNAPDEIVLSGDRSALTNVLRGREGRLLSTAGPWHSPAMLPARAAFESVLHACHAMEHGLTRAQWISAVHGHEVDASAARSVLGEGICTPVEWSRVMQQLVVRGVQRVVCLGPSRVMRGLVRKNLGTSVEIVLGTC